MNLTEETLGLSLRQACHERHLPADGAALIHHYNSAVFVLPQVDIIVRITTSQTAPAVSTVQNLTSWLTREQGFPATGPARDLPPVVLETGLVASFWVYYPQPIRSREMTSADLAQLLRALHRLEDPPMPLPDWVPLANLRQALADLTRHPDPAMEEIQWLRDEAEEVSTAVLDVDWPLGRGLIHGDSWAGNLLWDRDHVILGDWDNTSHGPREIDLIPTWHAVIRYGRPEDWITKFIATFGYDLATSPSFDLLLRMRDLVQLTGPLRRAAQSPARSTATFLQTWQTSTA